MNNKTHKIKQYIYIFSILVFWVSCSEEATVRNTCNQFIAGRIAKDKGDATLLEKITEDSLFTLLMLHQRYIEMIDVPVIGPDLNIQTKSVELKEDCATCMMSGLEYYKIHLCKKNGKWQIEGENGSYPTSEKIAKARKKIADEKLIQKMRPHQDSVFAVLNPFFSGAKTYFKTQAYGKLKQNCDAATIDVIERLYKHALKRTGKENLLKEMKNPIYVSLDITFSPDQATAQFYGYKPQVNFHKIDGNYIVTGLNGIASKGITDKVINDQYTMLLRALKLIRKKAQDDGIIK